MVRSKRAKNKLFYNLTIFLTIDNKIDSNYFYIMAYFTNFNDLEICCQSYSEQFFSIHVAGLSFCDIHRDLQLNLVPLHFVLVYIKMHPITPK